MLRLVRKDATHAKISTTPGGLAAPYKISGNVLQSLDPVPATYRLMANTLTFIDPYYHSNRQLQLLTPEARVDDLAPFVGEYLSAELETSYKISMADNRLFFEFVPQLKFPLFRLTAADFVFDYSGANFIRFTKEGLLFSREGCRQLAFQRKPD